MSKKIIGVASNFEVWENTEKLTLNYTYSKALEKVGAIPLIIPMTKNLDLIKKLIEPCSGLLVPGGSDISPLKFGQEPMKGMGEAKPDLDDFQLMITRYSLSIGLTFLGICRGAQVLNVALGGDLNTGS